MEFYDLFYKWVPVVVRLPVLFILLFAILTCNGIYGGNLADMAGAIGETTDPFTEASNALYIGMGCGLMIGGRLRSRFTSKDLLLYGLLVMLIMNFVCVRTENTIIHTGASLVLGFAKMSALSEVFILWIFVWSKKLDLSRVYPFLYLLALGGTYWFTYFTTYISYLSDWRNAYVLPAVLLGVCIIFALVFVERHQLKKKIPLFQVDVLGIVLLITLLMALNHIVVHGKSEDWFHSQEIKVSVCIMILSTLGFVLRQLTVKRPLIDLRMFRNTNLPCAVFCFLVLGFMIPGTFQNAFAGSVLGYNAVTNATLLLYLFPGVIAGAVFCFFWYHKKLGDELLIVIGFSSILYYHFKMYHLFANGITMQHFFFPSLFKGFAVIVLYISIGFFATRKLEMSRAMTASGFVIIVRSFIAGSVFSGWYNYLLYAGRLRHSQIISKAMDSSSPFTLPGVFIQHQAILSAAKELTGGILIAGIICLIVLILYFTKRALTAF